MTTGSPRSRGVCRHFACSSQQASRPHCHRCHAAHGSFPRGRLTPRRAAGHCVRTWPCLLLTTRQSRMQFVVNVNERMLKKYTNHGFLEQDFMQEWCLHVVFFPPSLIRTGFFKKEMEIFNQLVNDFCTKILKTYCLFSEDYVNCSGN